MQALLLELLGAAHIVLPERIATVDHDVAWRQQFGKAADCRLGDLGASELRILWMIVIPLCKPALVALAVFTFREAWDMYIWPLIIITKDSLRTLPLGISLFMSSYGTSWDQLMAIAVLGTLPMILLFFFLQRAFIQGIAATGLKE
jgi:ABC-type maltose transport system permease subunit